MGKAVQKKYADILHGSRPEPSYRHPRMTLSNRAKIFSPFAALRGYEEEIAAEGEEHLKVTKIRFSEEDKGKLSDKLLQVKKGMEVQTPQHTLCGHRLIVLHKVDVNASFLHIFLVVGFHEIATSITMNSRLNNTKPSFSVDFHDISGHHTVFLTN